eukprot:CAMPEP_0170483146 /NCGR_PEP_ID=MMETSP0208-20121228/2879_1 /TAXON_ID=197538 /ORGANISM="Strombidium inclinatum, Strain S3" /LENGTH=219 /DNA_ID=CAMNT_0010756079 /DNA_START=459 /DNA_END=1115 /DNA_ORIENTATION=-
MPIELDIVPVFMEDGQIVIDEALVVRVVNSEHWVVHVGGLPNDRRIRGLVGNCLVDPAHHLVGFSRVAAAVEFTIVKVELVDVGRLVTTYSLALEEAGVDLEEGELIPVTEVELLLVIVVGELPLRVLISQVKLTSLVVKVAVVVASHRVDGQVLNVALLEDLHELVKLPVLRLVRPQRVDVVARRQHEVEVVLATFLLEVVDSFENLVSSVLVDYVED